MNTRVLIAQIAHQSRVTLVHTLRPLVAERVAAAIARAMLEHLAQRFAARSRKVGPHRVIERRISQSVLAVNPLLARREADINPGAWTNKNQLDSLQRINDYYQALELLGYKPSDAETQALAGSLIEVMKEGDDHDDDNDAE